MVFVLRLVNHREPMEMVGVEEDTIALHISAQKEVGQGLGQFHLPGCRQLDGATARSRSRAVCAAVAPASPGAHTKQIVRKSAGASCQELMGYALSAAGPDTPWHDAHCLAPKAATADFSSFKSPRNWLGM